ncbi:hypothetical protein O3G_MSEX011760 [Manduca sexta]|uniref:Dicer-1 n=1 Tax=Manduca sexta TaxID=7130 RepID=A0A921ZNF6_MANSE|nr:hypothetical protein O3G_MSEX011760 [Manduca sexta]
MEPCTSRFTAAEGGTRLAAAASSRNLLVAEYSGFISTRLVCEEAYNIRGLLSEGRRRSIYVTRKARVALVTYDLKIMTDLQVIGATDPGEVEDWSQEMEVKEVLVATSEVIKHVLEAEVLKMTDINVMILDSCHLIYKDDSLKYIMKSYKNCPKEKRPRILALTYPLFTSPKKKQAEIKKDAEVVENDAEEENNDEMSEDILSEKKCTEVENKQEVTQKETEVTQKEEFGVYKNLDDYEMYEKLEWNISQLEDALCCQMDFAEDIDGGKRISTNLTKPRELIIEYTSAPCRQSLSEEYLDLEKYMKDTVNDALEFLDDHRHDPTEIYGEELYDEFKNIPDPTTDPRNILKQFLYVLEQLGPYGADKAAFSLLITLEKLKIKVPYERHFLLLCFCMTTFIKLRGYADYVFSKYDQEWDKIKAFSTPKVLRFGEILQKFHPNVDKSSNPTARLLKEIEQCDFAKLGDALEDQVNTLEANLKEIHEYYTDKDQVLINEALEKGNCGVQNEAESHGNKTGHSVKKYGNDKEVSSQSHEANSQDQSHANKVGFSRRTGRMRGRRVQRTNAARMQMTLLNPDALCGIVFVKEPLMAKILFMLIVDMSRCHPKLSYLCAQYCAVEHGTDPLELKECQRQGKKQEDVLKKFRMHECNLLLATPALEEGIDLPRCNLVLRWDVPPSYRSYLLCRGRARAPRSAAAVLSGAGHGQTDQLLRNVAIYRELDQIITRKCGCGIQNEPPQVEEDHADTLNNIIKPYVPVLLKNPNKTTNFIENKAQEVKTESIENESKTNSDKSDSKNSDENDSKSSDTSDPTDTSEALVRTENNLKNENLVCNKCTGVKPCASAECLCVNGSDVKTDVRYEVKSDAEVVASVDLNTAIALINRYCGKLPSDTFTRLAPQWWMETVQLPDESGTHRTAYICTLRLPLNCPVKYNIGHPMPTVVLAKRMVALQACRILHKSGELDDNLMPIGKENFKAAELETNSNTDDETNDSARPGTTKRRQYYYKRTAWAFTDCQPVIDTSDSEIDSPENGAPEGTPTENKEIKGECKIDIKLPISLGNVYDKVSGKRNMLYAIVCRLCCALPERYNTRGRRLHAPQHAAQALGILMARDRPTSLQIPAFPVYTRSGEVRVSVEHVPDADVRVSPRRGRLVRRFMRFVFSEVLRVRRRGMRLHSDGSTHNNYYIVPTIKTTRPDGTTKIDIDWAFLEVIYRHTEEKKHSEVENVMLWQQDEEDEGIGEEKTKTKEEGKRKMDNPLLKSGETFVFDAEKYREAVVTPWYRNQDQPQFFLVAEICWNLTPDSAFPSALHTSFRNYYQSKYGVVLTQPDQPLLDVDHTSARLNLLTPRYVNRKGVALPVSSERTRRAKRDRLDQKQILVPELCHVHPFAAPLWFATVALPCVLYRINALLIADEIRRAVAIDVGLGVPKIDEDTMPGFQWPPLDFGWSLAEVLSADSEKNEKKKQDEMKEKDEKETQETEKEDDQKTLEDEVVEEVVQEKTINDILQEKEQAESFEIGTWSNDMASCIPQPREYDEYMEPLPPNLTFCTSASGGADWCSPVEKPKSQYHPSRSYSVANSDYSYMSSDFDTEDSDSDLDGSDDETDSSSGFCSSKHSNAAMGVRIEYKTAHEAEAVDVERRVKVNPAPDPDEEDDAQDRMLHAEFIRAGTAPHEHLEKFRSSVSQHEQEIKTNGLIKHDQPIVEILPELVQPKPALTKHYDQAKLNSLFPYTREKLIFEDGQITIESIEKNKRVLLEVVKKNLGDEAKTMNCFSMKDVDIDSPGYVDEKIANVGFAASKCEKSTGADTIPYYLDVGGKSKEFDFDYQPVLEGHPGPSPSVILQALTMSNANDGINLERLETIGDSFLKFAITAYLYCAHPNVHEGKLSHMRSKQVSNLNLYRLGRNKRLGARMIASKFEPHDNWLPPCHRPPPTLHPKAAECQEQGQKNETSVDSSGCYIPYNLITQHSIPDKSIADCVEALIGAYLLECGPRGALLFMSWLGIRVLPLHHVSLPPGAAPRDATHAQDQPVYGELKAPPSPLLRYIEDPEGELEQMLSGYDALERTLQYRFQDRSLLLQALTHASHHKNRLSDCYQRLEFLGDAILDYLITRHLYEDARRHCPGALTDLRSALVNNTIFATLAAKHGFHKYFRHMSPGLNEVLTKYVKIQEENGHSISEEHYLIQEDEMEQAEDVEVPKALGDLFESVAGAIFLDSGMSLGAVWRSYVRLMGRELEAFSAAAPKSPVRELLEAEPDTAKFG